MQRSLDLKNRPNMMLLIAEDHAPWTLPAHGNTERVTPNFHWMCAATGSVAGWWKRSCWNGC